MTEKSEHLVVKALEETLLHFQATAYETRLNREATVAVLEKALPLAHELVQASEERDQLKVEMRRLQDNVDVLIRRHVDEIMPLKEASEALGWILKQPLHLIKLEELSEAGAILPSYLKQRIEKLGEGK